MPRIEVPAEVFDLYQRLNDLEQPDGCWPASAVVSVVCWWFVDHGIRDLCAPLSTYQPAPAQAGGTR